MKGSFNFDQTQTKRASMKTIKLFLTSLLLLIFATGLSFGQASNKNREVEAFSATVSGLLPCTDDYVTGTHKIVYVFAGHKIQVRSNGLYVGTSGSVYEWFSVSNAMVKHYVPGHTQVINQVINSTLFCEGEAIGYLKLLMHITINANGEISTNFEKGNWYFECL
jgi:hypothetical protein